MMYGSWDIKCDRQNSLSFWTIFCPFTPYKPTKSKFWKMKETPGDIITLHKCTKNHDHKLYCSWDMAHDGYNCYFSFRTIFCPFNSPKNQNFKKMKKLPGYVIILHKCTIIWYTVPEIWCMTDVIVIFHFGLFFALLLAPKMKISKKWKKHLEISSFYTCVPKIMIRWCTVSEKWCTTNGQTDGKSDI